MHKHFKDIEVSTLGFGGTRWAMEEGNNERIDRKKGFALIDAALERSAEYFAIDADGKLKVSESFLTPIEQHFNYDYFSGIEAAFDIRRSVGDKVVSIKYKGEELSGDKRLTLCINNYRASGAGGYDIYRQCQTVRELPTEIAELIIAYVDKHRNITVDKHKWLKLIY